MFRFGQRFCRYSSLSNLFYQCSLKIINPIYNIMVGISVLAGIIALVFAIIFYVKFFQMAADINRMSRLMEELTKKNKVSLKEETSAEQSQESASASSVNTDATQTTESTSENDDVFPKIGWIPIFVVVMILIFVFVFVNR